MQKSLEVQIRELVSASAESSGMSFQDFLIAQHHQWCVLDSQIFRENKY